jgi:catechol 2,3-dioxygenase-like lactoylglutathione lyase family enzyme
MNLTNAHLRIARPSDKLAEVIKFYKDGLGFEELYQFTDHDGFDGVMLGHKDAAYHLEFTRKTGHASDKAPTQENLLVFYLPDRGIWQRAVKRLEDHGYKPIRSFNPYWDQIGKTFEDPDGYRVVLQNASWPP